MAAPEPIAVVGLAGRFPGADTVPALWERLLQGWEAVRELSDDELAEAGVDPRVRRDPGYVGAAVRLPDVGMFDADFFGYAPGDAVLIDPQQRLFLEVAWEALESAGYDPSRYPGLAAVFAGTSANGYAALLHADPGLVANQGWLSLELANEKDHLATRTAYKLGLRGPALTVQTACSTGLVAIHLACQSLLLCECDLALAGGAAIELPAGRGYRYEQGGIASRDGRTRPFDAAATGTIRSSGAAVVVLKRLEDARRDSDTVYCVVTGSAINNDGGRKAGYTAPSVAGQAAVIAAAHAAADVTPREIGFVEGHGTATPLGDRIEVEALRRAFGYRSGPPWCVLGSIKGNLGHLDAAAGVAGFVKAALAVQTGIIPPTRHFQAANPALDLTHSPFFVSSERLPWPLPGRRRAGVSAFGMGGTNAHAVIEEAPRAVPRGHGHGPAALLLSARTAAALDRMTTRLHAYLDEHPEVTVADAAWTLQTGRGQFEHRRAAVVADRAGALAALGSPGRWSDGLARRRSVVFLFPGQGAPGAGAGRELYEAVADFRADVDRCAAIMGQQMDVDLIELMFGAGQPGTEHAQPALFTLEYALARQLERWGVNADAMLGHSVGELAAACLAEVFDLESALGLVATRGRAIAATPPGGMLAVGVDEATATQLAAGHGDTTAVAAVNSPGWTVLAGPIGVIDNMQAELRARRVPAVRLPVDRAFHSPLVSSAVPTVLAAARAADPSQHRRPLVSAVTGRWLTAQEAADPRYWAWQLRRPVRFTEAVQTIIGPDVMLVEVGPGRALTGHAQRVTAKGAAPAAVAPLGRCGTGTRELHDVTAALAGLWVAGADVAWERVAAPGVRVALPTYPFERRRYWPARTAGQRRVVADPDNRATVYVPGWRSGQRPPAAPPPSGNWLILAPDHHEPFTTALVSLLMSAGTGRVDVAVCTGTHRPETGEHLVEPGDLDALPALLRELERAGRPPDRIVHAWSIGRPADPLAVEPHRRAGFDAMIGLARGLADAGRPVTVDVVTSELFAIEGGDRVVPARALVLGPALVLPQEQPGVAVRVIDLGRDVRPAELLDELLSGPEHIVALRGGRRWIPDHQPLAPVGGIGHDRLAAARTVLITGGLGRIGTAVAEHLARSRGASSVLFGSATAGRNGRAVAQVSAEMARLGGEVLVVPGDVADDAALDSAWQQAVDRFGSVDAVFHCAGVASGAGIVPARTLGPAGRDEQLRPKVLGTLALARALSRFGACPVIAASSLAATLGGPDFAAYAAANAYLDAFAASSGGAGWTSVAWDGWRFPGTPQRPGTPALTAAAALQALDEILAAPDMPVLLVCAGGLAERRERWIEGPPAPAIRPAAASQRTVAAPWTATQRALAAILTELLGVEEVGLDDDFLDLGGHSLLGLHAVARIRAGLGVELGLHEFLDARTIECLAPLVERARSDGLTGCPPSVGGAPGE